MSQTDELLHRLTTSDNMDFCEDLSNIQSILSNTNDNIKPLNKILFRGGKLYYCHTTSVATVEMISIIQ